MSDDIDFSNEGLSSRVVSEEAEVAEPEAVEDTAEDQDGGAAEADDAPAETDSDVEDGSDESADADEPVAEEPAVVDDPYEVRYQEAQKVIGRQGQELGELRKQVEALMASQQQPEPDPTPAFQQRQPQTPAELLEMASGGDEAWEAYEFAAQYAPQMLPQVLAEVSVYDPAWAEQMRMDYSQRVLEAQYGPIQQTMQQATVAQQQAQAVQRITSQIDGFDQIREQVAEVVEQMPHLMGDGSEQAIQTGLEFAARLVRAEQQQGVQQAQVIQQQQSQQMRQQAAVESGTPASAPPPVDTNPADEIRNAIFAQDQQRRETITGL
jgi:hypothetical protein